MKKQIWAATILAGLALPAGAATTGWTDWTRVDDHTALGTLVLGGQTVDVTVSNSARFYFIDEDSGNDWWVGDAYGKGAAGGLPTSSDLLALNEAGTVTVTFSKTVKDIFFAFVSWNVPSTSFTAPVTIDSQGSGLIGSGSAAVDGTGTQLTYVDEANGVLKLAGPIARFSFTAPEEAWHGFTIGAVDPGTTSIPLPASAPLLLGALALLGIRRRG